MWPRLPTAVVIELLWFRSTEQQIR